jgi:hypothetical protein
MFELARERWRDYLSLISVSIPENDVRHNLGGEVRDRLRQLDLILKRLNAAMSAVTPDPIETQQKLEWMLANKDRVTKGELTKEEYVQALMPELPHADNWMDSWDDISIFTETFYHYAWRIVEILNGGGPYAFPGIRKVKAPAVTIVRNHLIQHPEKVKEQNFTLGLVILSSGPALRTTGGVIRGDSGRLDPLPESKDQGLFATAKELETELQSRLDEAIAKYQE